MSGWRLNVADRGAAAWHARHMLRSLGASVQTRADNSGSAADWAGSGAMALPGRRVGPALLPPGQAASAVGGALMGLETIARFGGSDAVLPRAREVLSERAALAGWRRNAPRSAGGSFQIFRAADGWVGVNLARDSDAGLIPAWLEDPGPALAEAIAVKSAGKLAERARLLGLPAAAFPAGIDEQLSARGQTGEVRPFVLTGRPGPVRRDLRGILVVDLSSLWAGPLCTHLLTVLGARVVKVESVHRPDGARFGSRPFYDLLHAGQESVALDFTTVSGRAALAALVQAADVVIEGSRPRALRQLGIDAEEALAGQRNKCWISITAYGRTGPWSNAVAFGDDAALAAGLVAFDPDTGVPAPCGDAIADPVTGVNAALVAAACAMTGGVWLADLAMREQVAATMIDAGESGPVPAPAPPTARCPAGPAPRLGADTTRILAEFGLS